MTLYGGEIFVKFKKSKIEIRRYVGRQTSTTAAPLPRSLPTNLLTRPALFKLLDPPLMRVHLELTGVVALDDSRVGGQSGQRETQPSWGRERRDEERPRHAFYRHDEVVSQRRVRCELYRRPLTRLPF